MKLREYQEDVIEAARESIRRGNKRLIIQASCGAGKTIISAAIISSALEKGKQVIFLVHFRQLAYQAMERFVEYGMGDEVGYIMAGEDSNLDRPVQIISVQTFERRLKLEHLDYNPWFKKADLVFYDECPSSISRTRKAVLDLYKDSAIIIGLSATPCRSDQRGLGVIYQDIVECRKIRDLISDGYLVPAVYYGARELPDLKNIPTVAGDYNQKVLGERVEKESLVGDILENFLRIAPTRQGVIFATNVSHSKYIKRTFEKHGIVIEHIDAHTPDEERQDILTRFKNGDVQIVTNCAVFSEGADFPWCDLVILAKPSKSLPRYIQMGSRGLRPWPGKDNCVIIDHAGLIQQHGFLDEPINWTLDSQVKAWQRPTVKEKTANIIECKVCLHTFMSKPNCPECGSPVKTYGRKVETAEADLVRLGKKEPKAPMADKRRFYGMLKWLCADKGYKEGWSAWKYKEKFQCWPKGLKQVEPIEPDKTFLNWITYLNIKRAKSRKAA